MNVETKENKNSAPLVLYDAECRFCLAFVRRFERLLVRHGFALLPLQTLWVRNRLGLSDEQLLAEMRLLLPDGNLFGGADALVEISRSYWWAFPLRVLARIPGGRRCLRAIYRWIARHRFWFLGRCMGQECKPPHHRHIAFFELP